MSLIERRIEDMRRFRGPQLKALFNGCARVPDEPTLPKENECAHFVLLDIAANLTNHYGEFRSGEPICGSLELLDGLIQSDYPELSAQARTEHPLASCIEITFELRSSIEVAKEHYVLPEFCTYDMRELTSGEIKEYAYAKERIEAQTKTLAIFRQAYSEATGADLSQLSETDANRLSIEFAERILESIENNIIAGERPSCELGEPLTKCPNSPINPKPHRTRI
ncbi:MAG TPA: hypothetical protein VMW25_03745 [Clostridia bacterium]|nr:hypothetical protein [Clostridia bacterium]